MILGDMMLPWDGDLIDSVDPESRALGDTSEALK